MPETVDPHVIVCPLKPWPGAIELPEPDLFNGQMWRDWRRMVEECKAETVNRLYGYAGAAFIEKHGAWKFDDPDLATFLSWQQRPGEERIRFVSWVGRSFQRYMDSIIDPKG